MIVAAVGLIASATAASGPIAFVAFLSGPIAGRIVRNDGSVLIPSALTGAVLVLAADYVGQHLLPSRYPVGVVTGALGAPTCYTSSFVSIGSEGRDDRPSARRQRIDGRL